MRKGFLIYEEMHKYFHHIWGGRLSYMTLHPIALNSLIYEENFLFFFYQCGRWGGWSGKQVHMYNQSLDMMPSSRGGYIKRLMHMHSIVSMYVQVYTVCRCVFSTWCATYRVKYVRLCAHLTAHEEEGAHCTAQLLLTGQSSYFKTF
jgi:hypothetical protein